MAKDMLSVTLPGSLTLLAWLKEICGICLARWYACGLLSITWRSGLCGSLIYIKSTRRCIRTRIVCFTGMNRISAVPPFCNVILICWQCAILLCSYDRIKHRKTDWPNIHKMHIKTFLQRVAEAKRAKGINVADHSDEGFNNYLRWFQPRTRLQLLPDAYTDVILEEPLPFDQLGNLAYNKLVREGRQVPFASSINFVVSLFFFLESHYYLHLPLVSLHIHIHASARRSRSKLLNSRWLWNCRRTKRAIQDCENSWRYEHILTFRLVLLTCALTNIFFL
jgi:hypothetical protein